MKLFSDNLALLREKERAIGQILDGQYREIIAASRESLSSPPAPDEIAALFAELGEHPSRFPRFCRAFREACAEEYRSLTLFADAEPAGGEPERIAYMQNAFSDRAYRIFSGLCKNARAIYFPGFREVAEEIGRAHV